MIPPQSGSRGARILVASLAVLLVGPFPLLGAAGAAPVPLAISGIHLWVGEGDIGFSSAYVEAGDPLGVSVTVHSGGDQGTNATLQFFLGDPQGGTPWAEVPFTVGADTTAVVTAPLNTSALVGIQRVTARLASIVPPETGTPADNEAWDTVRVHRSVVDMLWQGTSSFLINESYPHTGFITVRENATVTVGPAGVLSMEQRHDGEFDILVEGDATLRITGGRVYSAFALGVELRDRATLVVEAGGALYASVHSTGSSTVTVDGALIDGADLSLVGGSLLLAAAELRARSMDLTGMAVDATDSWIWSAGTITLDDSPGAVFINVTLTVESSYGSAGDAEAALPGVSAYLTAGSGPLQPALRLAGTSRADFFKTAAASTVAAAGQVMASTIPLEAVGAAVGNVFRTARISASDPTGAPVLNATVEVRHRSNGSLAATDTAAAGTAQIDLPATLLQSGAAFMVGQYKVTVTLGTASSPEVPFNFALFPDLTPASLVLSVPVTLPLYEPWAVAPPDAAPRVIATATAWSTDVSIAHNIVVNAALTLSGINVSLDQQRPFERFIVVTDGGSLDARASRLQSNYPFNVYVINGTSARFSEGTWVGANIIFSSAGNITFTDSRATGALIGTAAAITCVDSYVWGRAVDLAAAGVSLNGCVFAASDLISLSSSGTVSIASSGIGATFEPFDPLKAPSLSHDAYDAAATGGEASATASPAVRIGAGCFNASSVTVWTAGTLDLDLGACASKVSQARLVSGAITATLASGQLAVERSAAEGGAPVSFEGTGSVDLRASLLGSPSAAPGITLQTFAAVAVRVTDDVALPVPGATVRASPVGGGTAVETALTDGAGNAELLLLIQRSSGGATVPGPTYRINATLGPSRSTTTTWDASLGSSLDFALSGTFGVIAGDASFAVVATLSNGAWRLLASNLANDSVSAFLLAFGPAPGPLDFTSPVYPGFNATIYVAADYVFSQGPERATLPMAGQSASLIIGSAEVAAVPLGSEGLGSAAFRLPQQAGASAATLTIAGALLPSPLSFDATLALTPLPKLRVEGAITKANATFKPSEYVTIVGSVRDDAGAVVVGARVTIVYGAGTFSRTITTAADGSFVFKDRVPAELGSYALRITASAPDTLPADEAVFPYLVSTASVAPPPTGTGPSFNVLGVVLAAAIFVAGTVGLLFTYAQRRVSRGEFVVCGACEKPTLASDRKCSNCGVEFEAKWAKCSRCSQWIDPEATECPQCHTVFSKAVVAEEKEYGPVIPAPSTGVRDGYDIPESVPLTARRAEAGRLEDLEFRLPGTTDTIDLGDQGRAPTFSQYSPAPASAAAKAAAMPQPAKEAPLERMELPRGGDTESSVRDVSPMEGGEPTTKEPVSLGTANLDLSRTTAAATATKPDAKPEDEIPEDVLRELLMKAAPELSGDVLPGEIRKELQEIARGEAPVATEKRASSAPKAEKPGPSSVPPSERTAEAPEKSRKTAFDVFSKPTKNIPSGYEKKGPGAPPTKDGAAKAAPVCPNCGGNWVVQRDGKNSCRVCGTRW